MRISRSLILIMFIMANVINSPSVHLVYGGQARLFESQEKTKEKTKPEQKRPDEIVIYLNNVRSAPPEFAADLLISITESDKIISSTWKRELLDEAFHLAPDAQQPFRRKYTSALHPIDTRAGYMGYAFELNLDSLSLQCRAVRGLLSVDKQKARALFSEIPKLELKPISCEESLVYDVSDFYNVLTIIVQTAFTKKEISRNEHVRFMQSYISDIVSPVQVAPVANAILAIKSSRSDLETLIYSFANALQRISSDDRAFWFTQRSVFDTINKLLAACQQQAISTEELIRAYRTYLIKQLGGNLCADTYGMRKREIAGILDAFEKHIKNKSTKNILPISADEIKPLKIEGEERAFWYWQSRKAADLLTEIKKLRFGSGKEPLADAEKRTGKWLAELDDFLKDLANWSKEDEKSEEDYFHQKCHLYSTLVELTPESSTRDEVVSSYVAFLNEFDLQRGSRIEWFWQADYLIKRMLSLPEEKRLKLFEKIGITKNPILYLYMELGKLTLKPQVS
jgi:hypothetical protein